MDRIVRDGAPVNSDRLLRAENRLKVRELVLKGLSQHVDRLPVQVDHAATLEGVIEILELAYTLGRLHGIREEELDRKRIAVQQRHGGYNSYYVKVGLPQESNVTVSKSPAAAVA